MDEICVVIPVFNGERFLARALNSVRGQTHRASDILVIDDGSTDSSLAIAEATPGVRVLRQPNLGPTVARNRGIDETTAPLVAFLDADDEWLPTKLEQQIAAMRSFPASGYSITQVLHRTEAGATPGWTTANASMIENAVWGWLPSTLVVARSVFDSAGRFDAALRHSSDTEWFVRVRNKGIPVAKCAQPLVVRSRHDANFSGHVTDLQTELLTVIRSSLQRDGGRG